MKNQTITWLACCAGASLLALTSLAQSDATPPPRPLGHSSQTDQALDKSTASASHFYRAKELVGQNVMDTQGEKVGDINELYVSPQTGVTFAAIDISGSRHAVVPLQALKVTPGREASRIGKVTLNKTKSDLQSGPTITENQWHKLNDTTFTQQVFSHYNVQPPAAMGGSEPPEGSSTGRSRSLNDSDLSLPSDKRTP